MMFILGGQVNGEILLPTKLKDKVLGCWCKPLSCHGDVLVELIEIYCK